MRSTLITAAMTALMTAALVAPSFAGAGCNYSAKSEKTAAQCSIKSGKLAYLSDVDVKTTRLPSGALVVFYTSQKADVVKALTTYAEGGPAAFGCGLCKEIASAENCTVELAAYEDGVVAFITAEDPTQVDRYAERFAQLVSAETAVN